MLLVPADTLATPVPFYGKGLGGPLCILRLGSLRALRRFGIGSTSIREYSSHTRQLDTSQYEHLWEGMGWVGWRFSVFGFGLLDLETFLNVWVPGFSRMRY